MNKLKLLPLINTALIIGLGLFYIFNTSNKKESIVLVDNVKLFNEFNMTKEIRTIEEKKIAKKKQTLDSLFNIYRSIENKDSEQFKSIETQMSINNRMLQDIQNNYSNNLSQKVWIRINSYLKEYSEKNKLKLILGNNGSGNVLCSDEILNITDKALEYVNLKYEGHTIE